MTALIIDASAIGAYLLPDETSDGLVGLTAALSDQQLIVPPHWHFEVANLALMAVRRQRLSEVELPALAVSVRGLSVEIDALAGSDAWDTVMDFALVHRLTVYDAAYLALAKRRDLPLATLDKRLVIGARAENVVLFGQ